MEDTKIIINRYNRTAHFYDYMDFMISDTLRQRVIAMASGKVLEVGVGTGKNLKFYPPDCQVTGIDFSPGMLRKARERVPSGKNINLRQMDVQQLDFPDNTFDSIVATCVFCSVPDPHKGFAELRRVCKPDGKLILLEHVRSANRLLGLTMDLLNPIVVRAIGANINRETLKTMETAGMTLSSVENVGMEILKLIVATPNKKYAW